MKVMIMRSQLLLFLETLTPFFLGEMTSASSAARERFSKKVFWTKLNPFKEEEEEVGEELGGSLLSLSSGSWAREHVSSSISVHFR